MGILGEEYKIQEHKIKKLYDTSLLADLIRLNYCYSNKEYNNILGENIWNTTIKKKNILKKKKMK